LCSISSQVTIYDTPEELCLHSHYLTMCFATVEICSHCLQESCRALHICADAKRFGMIHIAKSIPDTCPTVEIANFQTDIQTLKVYSVLKQKRIQVLRCSHCVGLFGLSPEPLRAEEAQKQRTANELENALNALFGFDVHRE
jgi:hypothetical protein